MVIGQLGMRGGMSEWMHGCMDGWWCRVLSRRLMWGCGDGGKSLGFDHLHGSGVDGGFQVWRLKLRMMIVWFLFLFGTRFEFGAGVLGSNWG